MNSLFTFGIPYISVRDLFFSSGFKPNLLEKEMFSRIISSFDLLENSYVRLGVPFSSFSLRIFEM